MEGSGILHTLTASQKRLAFCVSQDICVRKVEHQVVRVFTKAGDLDHFLTFFPRLGVLGRKAPAQELRAQFPFPCSLPPLPSFKPGRMPLACACWHTCHMVLGVRLSKDDAPRTGWDTKPADVSPTSRTERPHPVPFPSQRHGEQAGTRLRQIQISRCTQKRPRTCAPE